MADRAGLEPARNTVNSRAHYPSATCQKLGAPRQNRTDCLPVKSRLLILMSLQRMVGVVAIEATLPS